MKKIATLLLTTIIPCIVFGHGDLTLTDALKKGLIKVDAVNTAGKSMGKAVQITITNNSKTALDIKINTGVILKPDNPAYQQLVLPGGEALSIGAHQSVGLDVEVFCDNGLKQSPTAGMHYSYYRVGGEELEKVLEYVRDNALFDHIGQAAVWSISNYLWIGCVYDSSMQEQSEKLIAHIVAVTRRPKPTYYATYLDNDQPGERAFVGRAGKIYVPFEVNLSIYANLTLAVYDMNGQLVKKLTEPRFYEAGKHNIMAQVVPEDYPKGKYNVRLMEGDKFVSEKMIDIQPWIMFGN